MSGLYNLGYVVFGSQKLQEWADFAVNILAMQIGEHKPGQSLSLRLDDHCHRILIEYGPEEDFRAMGWMLKTEDDLEAYVEQLRAASVQVHAASQEQAWARAVEKMYFCVDPNGHRQEFFCGPHFASTHQPFYSPLLNGPGFKTGELGVGHLMLCSEQYAASLDFYRKVLGLKLTDTVRGESRPGVIVNAAFFHTEGGRHHSLATTDAKLPRKVGHLMVEVHNLEDVGMAYDRCRRVGLKFARELGRHANDKMTSFYVETPSGFAIEYGWGGVVVDDNSWTIRNYSQFSDWGHARPGQAVR